MARAGLRKGHEDSSESPSATREVLPECMNEARRWAYHDGFHEESHGIGPMPIICRTAAASVKATKPKYGDGIEWKLKQDVDFLRDA